MMTAAFREARIDLAAIADVTRHLRRVAEVEVAAVVEVVTGIGARVLRRSA